ncbi:hypothetical protein GCM10010331_34680 [Streptomyces xanthochromogenes]|nr:hypothetical protein GCM10010331_34680 [Streptomyces xanthochromogenes]
MQSRAIVRRKSPTATAVAVGTGTPDAPLKPWRQRRPRAHQLPQPGRTGRGAGTRGIRSGHEPIRGTARERRY